MSGTLFVVATPIGNLEDLSPRARATLDSADLIAAEDTRHTGRLLSHFGVKTPLIALHDYNEEEVVAGLIQKLRDGKSVALVSDAGTPLISDPGFRMVAAAHENGQRVVPVAGPSAITAALSAAGLPTDRFCFEGFMPAKSKARAERLSKLSTETRSMVFYESVHRVRDVLADMVDIFGSDRAAFIGRELTKMHEQCVQGALAGLLRQLDEGDIPCKGEFVIIVSGSEAPAETEFNTDVLLLELAQHLPPKTVAKIVARVAATGRNDMYRRLLQLTGRTPEETD